MQVFLAGLVFTALFVLGVLTVWVQSESLQLGYEIETMRSESEALRRENDALRMRLAGMKTPASLLDQEGMVLRSDSPAGAVLANLRESLDPAPSGTLMPDWNVVWVSRDLDPARMPEYGLGAYGSDGVVAVEVMDETWPVDPRERGGSELNAASRQ